MATTGRSGWISTVISMLPTMHHILSGNRLSSAVMLVGALLAASVAGCAGRWQRDAELSSPVNERVILAIGRYGAATIASERQAGEEELEISNPSWGWRHMPDEGVFGCGPNVSPERLDVRAAFRQSAEEVLDFWRSVAAGEATALLRRAGVDLEGEESRYWGSLFGKFRLLCFEPVGVDLMLTVLPLLDLEAEDEFTWSVVADLPYSVPVLAEMPPAEWEGWVRRNRGRLPWRPTNERVILAAGRHGAAVVASERQAAEEGIEVFCSAWGWRYLPDESVFECGPNVSPEYPDVPAAFRQSAEEVLDFWRSVAAGEATALLQRTGVALEDDECSYWSLLFGRFCMYCFEPVGLDLALGVLPLLDLEAEDDFTENVLGGLPHIVPNLADISPAEWEGWLRKNRGRLQWVPVSAEFPLLGTFELDEEAPRRE